MKLPTGWEKIPLGQLVTPRYGKSLPSEKRDPSLPIPVAASGGIISGTSTPLIDEPCIVVGRKGNIGGAQLFNSGCWPIDTTYFFTIPDNLNSKFLALQLAAQDWGKLDSSTATPSLRREDLETISLTIPPLMEQLRIVEALDAHLSRLDAACTTLTSTVFRTNKLRQATISRTLRGEGIPLLLTEGSAEDLRPRSRLDPHEQPWPIPEGWIWTTVGSLFDVYVGTTPSRKAPEHWSGPIPWVSSGEVNFSRISKTREHISEQAVGNKKTRLHPPGTVMIAMIGEGKTRGQVGILDIEAAHNQNCASIRVSETRVLPEYIYLVLEQRYLETRKASSGGNQPALNKAKIESISVPLPPLATQRRIVAEIDEFSEVSNRLRLELHKALQRATHLRQAILSLAFTGKLLPQESANEAASVLLDRIRAVQDAPNSTTKRISRGLRKTETTAVTSPRHSASTTALQQELPL